MVETLDNLGPNETFDVVVVGAGGAGMSAALVAAIDGARVLLVEHTEYVGGSTAYSAGTTWIPASMHAASVNRDDTSANAEAFLTRAVGERSSAAMRRAFLDAGPKAVAHIEANSDVKYRARPFHPDYLSEVEGSTLRGRALEPLPFDGRKLGRAFSLIRPPIPEFTVLGGMMVDRDDVGHLLNMTKSFASLRHAAKLLARHARDRMSSPRGTRLVMGNALIGRLLYSLLQRGVTVLTSTTVEALHSGANGIEAVTLGHAGERRRVAVKGGVILASGGFNRHPKRRGEMLPGADPAWCPGAPGHSGSAQDLALAAGARFGDGALSNAFWAPVSVRKRADGTTAVFPHFLMDRGKPGMITVDKAGKRFVNENTSYHLFGIAMQKANQTTPAVPAYLVTDSEGLRKYGLGMVRPGGKGLAPFLADGYLVEGNTLDQLADKLGIDKNGLAESVGRNNRYAQTGVDADFQRGTTAYQNANGDANSTGPNKCLGPIGTAPFYAVRLYPGDIGAATGLVTDTDARVLNRADAPIGGLYACGNDMQSVMGGVYPGPGITLGPGLAFGYLAARHAAARAKQPASAALTLPLECDTHVPAR
ncbi:FAD-binding dehydrogenase [Burkholderia sp. SFA1]|uniref:FAD-dependent oxidoreductase n=1 Tax=unclassified Caballeronia TaxID=2646786 RepID=UPI001F34A7AF|nr:MULTISPECIES: FAD-dependent oxidoreductase [unclassified Caballeronia]MCE4544509.1 FAD-dependent oxidoreductase [Caballeronia sp. PC1]MCE4571661.1 FAD-dependent oxidoreductase [Caballeronia sp. CLC5]BBP98425.1 FAD-binding dehydrogenase [Burkholderia sp. SFA1]